MNPKDMTDQQLNRLLAERMGYKIWKTLTVKPYYRLVKDGKFVPKSADTEEKVFSLCAPDYCNDPGTSLEAQKAACFIKPDRYVRNLEIVKWGQATGWKTSNVVIAQLLNATPRQRAEAAYMTLQEVSVHE